VPPAAGGGRARSAAVGWEGFKVRDLSFEVGSGCLRWKVACSVRPGGGGGLWVAEAGCQWRCWLGSGGSIVGGASSGGAEKGGLEGRGMKWEHKMGRAAWLRVAAGVSGGGWWWGSTVGRS
jgi:hypothetical protein